MLYHLLYPLSDAFAALNVFRYITFRAAGAAVTALLMSLLLGPWFIEKLRSYQLGQVIREEGPETHQGKAGTPTMGGVLILVSLLVPTLLWAKLTNTYVWLAVGVTFAYGLIGFLDDFLKIKRQHNLGLTAKQKMGGQIVAGAIAGGVLYLVPNFDSTLAFPLWKSLVLDLGPFYIVFAVLVLVGTSNAVNLTDGLDGLAIGATLVAGATYAVFTYLAGNVVLGGYLQVALIPGVGEVTIFCAAMVGASLGFLWFNSHPAEVFMGDVGSLSIGAAIGIVALLAKQEILLMLVGGLFVLEALSVILQVASFKITGRRIFRMAPLHHHFELVGWAESKVIVRFWILSILFALLSLSTLKLR
jgi:phospho-N-acetylmuramoyl-pentapeptide-transferase